jgi:AraC-like DNA-binding protein
MNATGEIMLTFCLNDCSATGGFANGMRPRLLFMCRADGIGAATPRVMHRHQERFELMFIMQGSGTYHIDGRQYQAKQGDLLLFNAGVLHDECPHATDDLMLFSCGVEQLSIHGLPLNHLTPRGQTAMMPSGVYYDEIRQLFLQMWQHINSKKPYASETGHSLLQALLLICRTIWAEKNEVSDPDALSPGQRIKDFIDEHYKDNLDFRLITAELQMNRFYLAHLFKAFSGYSPKQYQTRRRIGEAQSLLLSTELGVTEVANAVGYDNVNNFHRIFHNLVGIPPARYKKFWLTGELKNVPTPGQQSASA